MRVRSAMPTARRSIAAYGTFGCLLVTVSLLATLAGVTTTLQPSRVPGFARAATHATQAVVIRVRPGTRVPGARPLGGDGQSVRINVSRSRTADALRTLQADPQVVSAEADTVMSFTAAQSGAFTGVNGATNDPFQPQQWALTAVNWYASPTVATATPIAFLDSGIDAAHPDLVGTLPDGSPKVTATWNSVLSTTDATDEFGHGTATSSVAAANTNNSVGIASVSPTSPLIMVKVGGMKGTTAGLGGANLSDLVTGLYWAVDHGARVVNISFGSPIDSPALRAAVVYAVDHNVVVVAAAGNDGCESQGGGNEVQYPAAYPHVIAVGATTPAGGIACFSNYGPEVDLAAPGTGMTMAMPTGVPTASNLLSTTGYGTKDGTSFAAPIVSGAISVLLVAHPDWSPSQVRAALVASARDIGAKGRDDHAGAGLLNMRDLLTSTVTPIRDFQEVNDDVQHARTHASLVPGSRRGIRQIRATIDASDDQSDVYAITLRRGQVLDVTLRQAGTTTATVDLWAPGTRTVLTRAAVRHHRLATATAHGASRTLTCTARRAGTYFLHVSTTQGSAKYALRVARH